LKLEDFNFQLPQELIASSPLKERSSSKLLVIKKGFKDLTFQFAAGGGHLQMAHEATNR